MIKKDERRFVVPGEKLSVLEEFLSGPGTYVLNGEVRSFTVGYAIYNFPQRKAIVNPLVRRVKVPKASSSIIGQVVDVQESIAVIRILIVDSEILSGFFTGLLHIKAIGRRRTKSMLDVCRAGDLIRAKVISSKNGVYHLSIAGRQFGVIYAFCTKCGNLLKLVKKKLVCEACGNIDVRKAASDYGKDRI